MDTALEASSLSDFTQALLTQTSNAPN